MKKYVLIFIAIMLQLSMAVGTNAKTNETVVDKFDYVNVKFWNKYNDPILTGHITEVYNSNIDLKIAALKVQEGERIVKLALSNELPNVALDGYAGRTLTSSDEKKGNILIPDYAQYRYLLPLTLSYEADIWGKNRLHTKAVKKQLDILKEDERSLYITLTSNFAINYYNLIKTDKLIELQEKLINTQKEICYLVEKRYNEGLAVKNDIIAEEKNLTFLEEELNNFKEKREILLNQLCVFLGSREFAQIDRMYFDAINVNFEIPNEIAFDTIEKRPDIQKSVLAIEKAGFDVRSSKRDFLPSFTINGTLGYNAYSLKHIFGTNTGLAAIGVSPYLTLFDGGYKYNRFKLLKTRYNRILEEHQKTLLTSAQEVNDALFSAKTTANNYNISEKRLNLQKNDYDLVTKKEKYGTANIIDVLVMEEKTYLTEQKYVSAKINEIVATINLYKAAGGVDVFTVTNL